MVSWVRGFSMFLSCRVFQFQMDWSVGNGLYGPNRATRSRNLLVSEQFANGFFVDHVVHLEVLVFC